MTKKELIINTKNYLEDMEKQRVSNGGVGTDIYSTESDTGYSNYLLSVFLKFIK